MLDALLMTVGDWFHPEHYWQLTPLVMALALGFFSLFFEDIALILGVAILHHDATLLMPVMLGLYFGITGGDVLIYSAGRWLQHLPWVARRLAKPQTHARITTLRGRMIPMLFICRVIPASRLPTFLAAGVVRVPFAKYVALSLTTVALWVALIVLGGFNLARVVEQMFGFSSLWLLLPLAVFMGSALFLHAKGRRYAV